MVTPAIAAACRSAQPSPSTASACARPSAPGPRLFTRAITCRAIPSRPPASNSAGCSAPNGRPLPSAARSSSARYSGLPPQAWYAAPHNSSLASPSAAWITALTACSLNSAGRSTAACARTAASGALISAGSPWRIVTSIPASSPSSRAARYASQRSDGSSAQCASSTAISRGPLAAKLTTSQYKPCNTANELSPAGCIETSPDNSRRAAAAGPASSTARSLSPAAVRHRSNNWRTTPNAKPDSNSEPRARTTSWPSSSAREQAASTSEVLPMPARPSTSSTSPRCSSSTSTAASSRSRSRSLPTRPACRLRPSSVHSMPTCNKQKYGTPERLACPA